MLKFDAAWRFETPGAIPDDVAKDVFGLIGKIAASEADRQGVLEHFKRHFASATGSISSWSSSASWAETDLYYAMERAAENAPLFIEAFYDGCVSLQKARPDVAVPDLALINRILQRRAAGYEIDPPKLIARNIQKPIGIPSHLGSLDEQAQDIIQRSLHQSEELLAEGRYRQAVQEIVWLLETVATAFKGVTAGKATVQGKYFNKIVSDLQRHDSGTTLQQVLSWIAALHGYLSSPTGGGVRHGIDLKAGNSLTPEEARLFCNLIRSYITFLVAEHDRLTHER
jgi:hypothetical protein